MKHAGAVLIDGRIVKQGGESGLAEMTGISECNGDHVSEPSPGSWIEHETLR